MDKKPGNAPLQGGNKHTVVLYEAPRSGVPGYFIWTAPGVPVFTACIYLPRTPENDARVADLVRAIERLFGLPEPSMSLHEGNPTRSCNRHEDCDEADADALSRGHDKSVHTHDWPPPRKGKP